MNPALIRSRSLNFSRVRSIPSRTWIEAATSTSSLILSSSLAQTRSASTSTFENLVAFRRRNNLDELPKLDSKERSSKNKKKFGDSAANRLRISKHSEWTDDQKEIFYRTRAGQRKLNEALSEIHSEMKRASRHSSYRPEGLSSPISSNDQLWEQAFELFESSPKAHQRDFRVYNQLVAMAFKAGKFNRAMDLVSDFKKLALTPSLSTFTTVFSSLSFKSPPPTPDSGLTVRAKNLFLELESMRHKAFNLSKFQEGSMELDQDLKDEIHFADVLSERSEEVGPRKISSSAATFKLRQETFSKTLEDLQIDREGLVGAYVSYIRFLFVVGEEKEANELFDRLALEGLSLRSENSNQRFVAISKERRKFNDSKPGNLEDREVREYSMLPPYPHKALFTIMFKSRNLGVERFLELLKMRKSSMQLLENDKEVIKASNHWKEEVEMLRVDSMALASILSFLGRADVRDEIQKKFTLENWKSLSDLFEEHFFTPKVQSKRIEGGEVQEDRKAKRSFNSKGFEDFKFPSSSQLSKTLHLFFNAKRPENVLKLMNQLEFLDLEDANRNRNSLVMDVRHLNQVLKACNSLQDCESSLEWIKKGLENGVMVGNENFALAMRSCSIVQLEDLEMGLRTGEEIWKLWRNAEGVKKVGLVGGGKDGDEVKKIIKAFMVTIHRAVLRRDGWREAKEGEVTNDQPSTTIPMTRQNLKSILEVFPLENGDGLRWIKNLQEGSDHQKRSNFTTTSSSSSNNQAKLVCRIVQSLTDTALTWTLEEKAIGKENDPNTKEGKYEKGKDKYGRDRGLEKAKRDAKWFWILNQAARGMLGVWGKE